MQIAFQARRIAGRGWLVVGFRHGSSCRAVAVRPAPEEAYPDVLPPAMKVVDVPAAEGWHEFMLLEGPEGVALWADRMKYYIAGPEEIREWDAHPFHLFGFGLASGGGTWEIRDIKASRKNFD
jgi:hypothetical protein